MAKAKWKSTTVERDGEILTVYLHPPGTFRNPDSWAWTCKKVGVNGRVELSIYAREKALL